MRRSRINRGDFRDLINILSDDSDDTDEQQSFTGFPLYAAVPAKIDQVGGNEKEQTAFVKFEITIYYLDNITSTNQVSVTQGTFAGKTLNIGEIETVIEHGRPRFLVFHCIEVD